MTERSTIDPDSVIRRAPNHLETRLDDETIMMHVQSGMIYAMAEVAHEIWAHLREPIVFDKLIVLLIERFDVDRETCVREVGTFLRELEQLEFVKIEPHAP